MCSEHSGLVAKFFTVESQEEDYFICALFLYSLAERLGVATVANTCGVN